MKSKTKIPFLGLAAVLLLLSPSKMFAAYNAYLYIDGIQGEATAGGFTNQIVVLSFSESVSNVPTIGGSGGGAGAGKAVFADLTIAKMMDAASPLLYLNCAQGTRIGSATLTLCDQTTQAAFYTIKLSGVYVTSVQTSGSSLSDVRPNEMVTLHFETIDVKYQQLDSGGNVTSIPPEEYTWNTVTNSPTQ